MKTSGFDSSHLDVAAFIKAEARIESHLPQARLERLGASTQVPADGGSADVEWAAEGRLTRPLGRAQPELRLRLVVRATVHQTCQRCLQPVAVPLEVDRTIRFVHGEDEAARLDDEIEEDVLALPRWLDLAALIEDELILALPIVPMHEACPQPLKALEEASTDIDTTEDAPPNPFAALAALKTRS